MSVETLLWVRESQSARDASPSTKKLWSSPLLSPMTPNWVCKRIRHPYDSNGVSYVQTGGQSAEEQIFQFQIYNSRVNGLMSLFRNTWEIIRYFVSLFTYLLLKCRGGWGEHFCPWDMGLGDRAGIEKKNFRQVVKNGLRRGKLLLPKKLVRKTRGILVAKFL